MNCGFCISLWFSVGGISSITMVERGGSPQRKSVSVQGVNRWLHVPKFQNFKQFSNLVIFYFLSIILKHPVCLISSSLPKSTTSQYHPVISSIFSPNIPSKSQARLIFLLQVPSVTFWHQISITLYSLTWVSLTAYANSTWISVTLTTGWGHVSFIKNLFNSAIVW